MGLFKKKEKKVKEEISGLPELPKLPEFPGTDINEFNREHYKERGITEPEEEIPMLPSFPNGSLGNKFSQNTIKEAISGGKEVSEAEADESEEDIQMMPKPPIKRGFYPEVERMKTKEEPIFIRIDKFEAGLKTFGEIRKQILEIEGMFEDLRNIKEKEEKELEFWEREIRKIKGEIEKIDKNIFSKIE
jgi:hypothetical protein